MMDLPHDYTINAAAKPVGAVSVSAPHLTLIESAPPKEFGGPGDQWSPEDFLVGAVADCFVLSFRAIAVASKFEWIDLKCTATGKLDKVERAIQFTEISISATLTVPAGTDETRAQRLLEKAEQACFITNSLKAPSHLDAKIVVG